MGAVLTTDSTISCPSSGSLTPASTAKLRIAGARALTKTSVSGKTVSGCTQTKTNAGEVPCSTAVVSGGEARKLKVGGAAVLLEDTFAAKGNGTPLDALTATAKQAKLEAV